MRKIWFTALLSGVLFGSAAGCSREQESGQRIVASNSIIADVIGEVLGDTPGGSADKSLRLDVVIPVGENGHSFVPKPSTARMIEEADLIVVNGLGLEGEAINRMIQGSGADVLDLSLSITPLAYTEASRTEEDHLNERGEFHDHGEYDPHHWFTPLNVVKWVDAIAEKISLMDESNQNIYMKNAEEYKIELRALHEEINAIMSELSPGQRDVLVDHMAITFYSQEYGLNVHGSIIQPSGEDISLSSQNLVQLKGLISDRGILAIIIGNTARESVQTIAQGLADTALHNVVVVKIMIDTLAHENMRGSSYVDFMRYNTDLIFKSLSQG